MLVLLWKDRLITFTVLVYLLGNDYASLKRTVFFGLTRAKPLELAFSLHLLFGGCAASSPENTLSFGLSPSKGSSASLHIHSDPTHLLFFLLQKTHLIKLLLSIFSHRSRLLRTAVSAC